MKKKVLFLTIILSIFSINIVNGQGWKKFRNVLKKEFNGLTPYSIPDVNYSPGSVLLIYSKNEQLYASRALQFPTLTLQPPSPIPSTKIVKVSQISFDVNADSQIIPNELTEVAKLGYDSKSTFNFGMKKAQKHQIEIGPLELLINNLDITNTKDKLLLEKLTNENCVVVAQALFVNGMTFSFKRQNKINADIKANITKAATNANLKLNILNDYEFTLESDTSIYYAFDIYHKNTDQLKKLYEDKKKIVELKQKKEDNIGSVEQLKQQNNKLLNRMESIKYGLITYQKEKAESLSKSHANGINYEKISDGLTEKYKDELRFTESQIEGINLELTYSKKLDEENTDLIKELSAKKYKLFTKSNDKNELDKLYQYEQLN